jgi:hypothetical protein
MDGFRALFQGSVPCDAGSRCYLLDATGYVIYAPTFVVRPSSTLCNRFSYLVFL